MTVYTRTGDDGKTDLLGGARVPKDAARLEVCGPLDELNCWLGLAQCEPLSADVASLLERIQRRLFDVCTELVTIGDCPNFRVSENGTVPFSAGTVPLVQESKQTPDAVSRAGSAIGSSDVQSLEQAIDRCEAKLDPLDTFILPAGSRAAAVLHLARAVCRRAERRLVSLARGEPEAVSADLLAYVNRLSDLLFVLARTANGHADIADTLC